MMLPIVCVRVLVSMMTCAWLQVWPPSSHGAATTALVELGWVGWNPSPDASAVASGPNETHGSEFRRYCASATGGPGPHARQGIAEFVNVAPPLGLAQYLRHSDPW